MKIKFALLCLLLLPFIACSNSDDDSGDQKLSKNACSTLGLNTRIIDGTACQELGSPVVKIQLQFADGSAGLCSGTMITPDAVLTAAHCFFSKVQSAFIEVNQQRIGIASILQHPDVTTNEEALAVFNDVAVVQLTSATGLPVLPILGSRDIKKNDKIAIFGYGLDNDGVMDVLRSGEMRVSNVTESHIFAPYDGDEGSNTCNGDSGGPAIYSYTASDGTVKNTIVGIVSSGNDVNCGPGDTTLFTNVQSSSVFDFILDAAPKTLVE